MKRRQHALHLFAAPARPLRGETGRQPGGNRTERGLDLRGGRRRAPGARQLHVHAVDATQPIEGQLRRRDVHQHEAAVHHARRPLVLQQPADHVGVHAIASHQPDLVAQRIPAPPCHLLGDDDAAGAGEQFEKLLRGHGVGGRRALRQGVALAHRIVAERQVAEDVHAQHLHRLAATCGAERDFAARRDARAGVAWGGGDGHFPLDHRGDGAELAKPAEVAEQSLVDARGAQDLQRGPARDGVERGLETAHRTAVGQLDGDDHGDAEGDAHHGGHRARPLLRHAPQDELPKQPQEHGGALARRPG